MCEDCALKSGFDVHGPMSISDILLGMGNALDKGETERACPRCHFRRSDFKKTGRLGCSACYDTFAGELMPLVKAMHRSEQHMGKVPARESVRVQMSTEIAGLQKSLDQAVAGEKYEDAAQLRDQIQKCKQRMAEEEKKDKP
jgi:protein arginine kinase activator